MIDIFELKNCPFCGGESEVMEAMDAFTPCYGVCCKKCNVMIGTVASGRTDFFRTVEAAKYAWNRRT